MNTHAVSWAAFISIATLVATFAISIGSAEASHSWGGYHWARTANPFTLKLGDDLSSNWDAYLTEASASWNVDPTVAYPGAGVTRVLSTAIVAGNTNPKNCRAVAGRVEVCNSRYGNNGWLGIASIWVNSLHITQGTVKLNDTYFNTPTYNTPAWKRLVACQEVAHTFGLDHQDTIFNNYNLGTCMDYTNAPAGGIIGGFDYGPSNEYTNFHDFEELAIIYGHLDSATTLSQLVASKNAADIDSNDPSAWGKETRRTSDGRASVFEQDLGNGQKILRHVFWAEPRGHQKN